MVRRKQQIKRDERRAQRELEESLADERGRYEAVDRSLCMEKSHIFLIDDGYEFRVQLRFWRHEGQTTEFVYLFQRRVWDDWENVARIDCSHGSCHVHDPDGDDPTEHLHRLDTIEDVEEAMRLAQARARSMHDQIIRREAA